MASVEQQILVKIKTIVEGLAEVKALSSAVNGIGKGGSGGAANLTGGFLKAGIAAGATNAAIQEGISLLEQLGSAGLSAIGGFVTEGVKFNATIESAKIGIASIVANTYDVKDATGKLLNPIDSFNASLGEAEHLERALQKSAIETKFEFQDILGFFQATVIAGAGLKGTLSDLVHLTQDFALAAGAANIEEEKVRTGIQQILTGNTTVRNQLARVVFPGLDTKSINETLKKQREAGTLIEFLTKKLAVFRLSADVVGQSFEAVASNTKDAFKVFEAASTLPLFDKLKQTLGFIIGQVVDLTGDEVKLTPPFQKLADILGDIFGFLGSGILNAVKALFGYITQFAEYLDRNKGDVEQIVVNLDTIVGQIGGIAADMLGIVTDTAAANDNTSGWKTATGGVALFLGFIHDILNVIIGTLEAIIGAVVGGIGFGLTLVSNLLLSIVNDTKSWLGFLVPVGLWLGRIADALGDAGVALKESGTDRLISGLNSDQLAKAGEDINRKITRDATPRKKSNFTFNPRNFPTSTKGDKVRGEQDRLKAAQQLFNEIEKYQIANANREVELFAEANKQILTAWQRRYDQGLISAADFYKEKAKLENDDLDRQTAALAKEKKAADLALARDLGAIVGKFNLSPDEVAAITDKVQGLTESGSLAKSDAKTIRQATTYVKYLEQTAAITQKLAKIEKSRQNIQSDSAFETEKQARANKLLLDSLSSEFASSQGNDGLKDLFDLQKRVADEFPKILAETNKTSPELTKFVDILKQAGEVDISTIPAHLEEAGLKIEGLSEESRLFIKLLERLQDLAKIKSISSDVSKAQEAFKFSNEGTQTDFENGRISLSTALQQNTDAKTIAVAALTKAYEAQKLILKDLQDKKIATPQDVQAVDALGRAIQSLNTDLDKLNLIKKQSDRDDTKLQQGIENIANRQRAGAINSKQVQIETQALQAERIRAYEDEIARLQGLKDQTTDVVTATIDARLKLAGLRNEINTDALTFASGINGLIGDSFKSFISDITSGTKSIGESFRTLLAGLLSGIANAIAQAILLKYILKPLGLTGNDTGGAGGFLSGLGGIFSSLFGGGSTSGAPPHADGGIISGAGTGVSDSIPAMLSHGEGIIPANRVQQYGTNMIRSIISGSFLPRVSFGGFASGAILGGGSVSGGRGGTRIVNTVDPNLVRDFMTSPDGEQVILNVIGRNPGVVQRLA